MEGFYAQASAAAFPDPRLLALNEALAAELKLDVEQLREHAALVFSGQKIPKGAAPIAQVYAGHQFGGFSPQLGDGRAMMLGEIRDIHGKKKDIQLKGSGPTYFSRGGDGLASIGPVLREYLMGEAMHALGIPTTRMLAAVSTGKDVYRERAFPGAVVTRVASSHIRVGTFEFFAARGDHKRIKELADFVIERHFPELLNISEKYAGLLDAVCQAQAHLIAQWMLAGFIHGVMNTDNMTISGETIDFGPCAFMDRFSLQTVFSSIDNHGRYAYGNQPPIGEWNLTRFAETLLPLIDEDIKVAVGSAEAILQRFRDRYQSEWKTGMQHKLGLLESSAAPIELFNELTVILEAQGLDYTSTMRGLSSILKGEGDALKASITDKDSFESWEKSWLELIDAQEGGRSEAAQRMDRVNPVYIPRNHLVEEALEEAIDKGDLSRFNRLLEVLKAPFEECEGFEEYAEAAPESFTACYKTFCGT